MIELDPVDRITTGAVGPPGERVFYLQGRRSEVLVTILVEKQQVELLAASLVEILARAGKETGQGPSEGDMELEEPVVPEWRAGRLSIGYDEERDLVLLEAEEYVPEEEDEDEDDLEGPGIDYEEKFEGPIPEHIPGKVRFWASRDQAFALARHGAAVAAAGRPRCQFCGNPMEADAHVCPAMNGHHTSERE